MADDRSRALELVNDLQRLEQILQERFGDEGLHMRYDSVAAQTLVNPFVGGGTAATSNYAFTGYTIKDFAAVRSRLEAHITAMPDSP